MKSPYEYSDTNSTHLRERADALDAQADGLPTQFMSMETGEWNDRSQGVEKADFNQSFRYRRKPTPVARRWNRKADIPAPICWVRRKGDVGNLGLETMIASRSDAGFELYNNGERFISFKEPEMIDALEHSTDCVNWSDLTTTES